MYLKHHTVNVVIQPSLDSL